MNTEITYQLGSKGILVTLSIVILLLCSCKQADNTAYLREVDVSGIYRLDTSRLYDQKIPDSFYSIGLTLFADGSFVATNVPSDFFFDFSPTPATPQAKGSWTLEHESGRGSLFFTGEIDYLVLDFDTPFKLYMSIIIESGRSGAIRIPIQYHHGKTDSAKIFLLKQK